MTRLNFLLNRKRRNIYLLFFTLFISTIFLLICSKSSPLYLTNDWTDANASFTMGKAMMNGNVLYKDIFNQKGPLVYTIHGIAYLISNKSFFGVFLFEVLFFTIFLIFAYKIFRIYLSIEYSLLAIPTLSFLILNNKNFSHGDSPEQFCLTFLMISLYYLVVYVYQNPFEGIPWKVVLLNGFIGGIIVWMKYSLIGFWLGWIAVLTLRHIFQKEYKIALIQNILFLFGMFIATIPFLIYFAMNGAIQDWIYSYFYVNLNYYVDDSGIFSRLFFILKKNIAGITRNILFGIITLFGVYKVLYSSMFSNNMWIRILFIFPFLLLSIFIYLGGRGYIYYFILISPIVIFGIIASFKSIQKILIVNNLSRNKYFGLIAIFTISLLIYTFLFNHNSYMLRLNNEDLIQFTFAEKINETPDATLLNYGCLDVGVYTTTGIIPELKYYQIQNIDYDKFPINIDEQNRYINEKLVDYVIMKQAKNSSLDKVFIINKSNNYRLIFKQDQMYEGSLLTYSLYQKNQ